MATDTQQITVDESGKDRIELERLQLENEKLRLEIQTLGSRLDRLTRLIPFGSLVLTLAGIYVGVSQYRGQQQLNRDATQAQFEKDLAQRKWQDKQQAETARREFMKPLTAQLLSLSLEAASAAATIATTTDVAERRKATNEFWRLYQGPLILVEDAALSDAMVKFGYCLTGAEKCNQAKMERRARAIGSAGILAVLNSYRSSPETYLNDRILYLEREKAGQTQESR